MAIDIKLIKELRELTGAGIIDSKKALEESDSKIDLAIEWLRKNGISKASKKSGRIAAEGIVYALQNENKISLIEVNSETDFVASNEKFINAVKNIMSEAIKHNITVQEDFENLIIDGEKVNDIITNLIATIGEKISIRRYVSFNTKDVKATFYMHSNKRIATLIISDNVNDDELLLKDVAMHITAMNPKFAYISDIDEEFIKKEREIISQEYKETYSGKPENVLENIINGALSKQLAELTLEEQVFVKDSSKKIKDLFPKSKIRFVRYEVGEGIQKEVVDFAKEVMAQVNNK